MESPQTPRVVLLGASNVTLSWRTLTDAARAKLGGPIEVLAACGNGRSYGMQARFLTRILPSIERCGLWTALETRPAARTFALVTDYGNDVGFGAQAAQVAQKIEIVFERLERVEADTVVTGLPVETVAAVGRWQFLFWKNLFFPTRKIERESVVAELRELDQRVAELARRHGFAKVDPRPHWYGYDPIHIRRERRAEAWSAYVAPWKGTGVARAERADRNGRLWYEQVRLFGRETGRPQPCAALSDGTTFSLY